MDNKLESKVDDKIPSWDCVLSPKTKEPSTVGDIKDLTCRGVEFVDPGKKYNAVLDEKFEHTFKILKVKEDAPSRKVFAVTTYRPVKGDLVVKFEKDGVLSFSSVVRGVHVESVAKTPEEKKIDKPLPPVLGFYIAPSTLDLVLVFSLIFSVIGIVVFRVFKKLRIKKEFKKVVSNSKYADPFMDFNVEMRSFSSQKKKSAVFLMKFEESLKKVLYRVFDESVSLENMPLLVRNLKGLGLEPHEIRSFYVLEEEYSKFQKDYKEKSENFYEFKKSFIDQTKKTINKLKRYSSEGVK